MTIKMTITEHISIHLFFTRQNFPTPNLSIFFHRQNFAPYGIKCSGKVWLTKVVMKSDWKLDGFAQVLY